MAQLSTKNEDSCVVACGRGGKSLSGLLLTTGDDFGYKQVSEFMGIIVRPTIEEQVCQNKIDLNLNVAEHMHGICQEASF